MFLGAISIKMKNKKKEIVTDSIFQSFLWGVVTIEAELTDSSMIYKFHNRFGIKREYDAPFEDFVFVNRHIFRDLGIWFFIGGLSCIIPVAAVCYFDLFKVIETFDGFIAVFGWILPLAILLLMGLESAYAMRFYTYKNGTVQFYNALPSKLEMEAFHFKFVEKRRGYLRRRFTNVNLDWPWDYQMHHLIRLLDEGIIDRTEFSEFCKKIAPLNKGGHNLMGFREEQRD